MLDSNNLTNLNQIKNLKMPARPNESVTTVHRSNSTPNRHSRRDSGNISRSRNSSPAAIISNSMSQIVLSKKTKKTPKMSPIWDMFTFHSLCQYEDGMDEGIGSVNKRVDKNYLCNKCQDVRLKQIFA